jgi:hypothetical protein
MEEELVLDMEHDLGVLCALEPPPEITILERRRHFVWDFPGHKLCLWMESW